MSDTHATNPLSSISTLTYHVNLQEIIPCTKQKLDTIIAKIDRTLNAEILFTDDKVLYNKQQIDELIDMITHGNKNSGGLKKRFEFHGIFGFVSFLEGYYMILITKKSPVALIGGHYIYHIDDTIMLPIIDVKIERKQGNSHESRYLQIFSQVDTTKTFYFSYSYDISRSLQSNLSHLNPLLSSSTSNTPNELFVWNTYLTKNIFSGDSDWFIPIIHGFVDQSKISVFGHNILVTLIARRSRHYAGARFLKRGVSEQGYVANDVETEQIVNDESTTLFSNPSKKCHNNCGYTSFLQHRGSIPLYWSQDVTAMAAKPSIQVDYIDPFYTACTSHFNDLFIRYGSPIIVLNLVKGKEKVRREGTLLDEFTDAINYMNVTLPESRKITYIAWDMARASKSDDQDVIGTLEKIANNVLESTNFFHSGTEPYANAIRRANLNNRIDVEHDQSQRVQRGIVRTNCIDCLDRTNAAQFVIGKCALGQQLFALGVIPEPSVPFDSDAINIFNAMYHDHGDTIALQYGGSHLVNTMETYRKMSVWTSHSRDMIESIKRYYSNSFTDAEKQDAINLFLGNFVPRTSKYHLWDLCTDFYLHNEYPINRLLHANYSKWWDGKSELQIKIPKTISDKPMRYDLMTDVLRFEEYYSINEYTSIGSLYLFNMISTDSNLNIGGVSQWLRPSKVSGKSEVVVESKSILPKDMISSPNLTASLVTKLLVPDVKVSEAREYKRYITQFRELSISHDRFDESKETGEHPDIDFFTKNVNITTNLSKCDTRMYKSFVVSGLTDLYVGIGSRSGDVNRFEGYQHWFETGVYPACSQKNKLSCK